MDKKFFTIDPLQTEQFGAEVGEYILNNASAPKFIALFGDLGVGKTAFVRGLASVLAPCSAVRSPTFSIVNEYKGKLCSLFHFDMYRIEDEDELYSVGFYDYLDRGICVTEWSENIEYALPDTYLRIEITKPDLNKADMRLISAKIISKEVK